MKFSNWLVCPFRRHQLIGSSPLGGRVAVEVSASRKSHESGPARHLQRPVQSSRQHPVNLPEACAAESGNLTGHHKCVAKKEAWWVQIQMSTIGFWMSYFESCKTGLKLGIHHQICFLNGRGMIPNLIICTSVPPEVFKWKPGCIQKNKTCEIKHLSCEIESPPPMTIGLSASPPYLQHPRRCQMLNQSNHPGKMLTVDQTILSYLP